MTNVTSSTLDTETSPCYNGGMDTETFPTPEHEARAKAYRASPEGQAQQAQNRATHAERLANEKARIERDLSRY